MVQLAPEATVVQLCSGVNAGSLLVTEVTVVSAVPTLLNVSSRVTSLVELPKSSAVALSALLAPGASLPETTNRSVWAQLGTTVNPSRSRHVPLIPGPVTRNALNPVGEPVILCGLAPSPM